MSNKIRTQKNLSVCINGLTQIEFDFRIQENLHRVFVNQLVDYCSTHSLSGFATWVGKRRSQHQLIKEGTHRSGPSRRLHQHRYVLLCLACHTRSLKLQGRSTAQN